MLRMRVQMTRRLQRDSGVTHLLAEEIEDMSHLLDTLLAEEEGPPLCAEPKTG